MRMNEKEKMLAGEPYLASDAVLTAERYRAKALCARYNRGAPDRDPALLEELLGYRTDAYLEPPFHCDYGYNLRLGRNVYANHNLVVLDCALVTVGDDVAIGPNVVLSAAGHPLDPEVRASALEFSRPITLGDRVWIGACVVVVPGVTIGEGTTIGAGSVVTKPIPARCVAAGNPCRVLRTL
jgi:maltose O-acetyltransferase